LQKSFKKKEINFFKKRKTTKTKRKHLKTFNVHKWRRKTKWRRLLFLLYTLTFQTTIWIFVKFFIHNREDVYFQTFTITTTTTTSKKYVEYLKENLKTTIKTTINNNLCELEFIIKMKKKQKIHKNSFDFFLYIYEFFLSFFFFCNLLFIHIYLHTHTHKSIHTWHYSKIKTTHAPLNVCALLKKMRFLFWWKTKNNKMKNQIKFIYHYYYYYFYYYSIILCICISILY